jgi:hypothetical protein
MRNIDNIDSTNELSSMQRAGMVVFIFAVVCTAVLVWMGISGRQWPDWLLALTTVL